MLPFDVAFENSTKEKRTEHNEKSLLFLVLCVFKKKWYSEDFTGTKRRFRTKQKHRRKVRKSKGEKKQFEEKNKHNNNNKRQKRRPKPCVCVHVCVEEQITRIRIDEKEKICVRYSVRSACRLPNDDLKRVK